VVFALAERVARGVGGRIGAGVTDSARYAGISRHAGLLAAFAVAVYPTFIHSTGEPMSEPPAILMLPAAVLAWPWAANVGPGRPSSGWRGERGVRTTPPATPLSPAQDPLARWLLPGILFGALAMFRPEYLLVGGAFAVLAATRTAIAADWRRALAGAAVF